jgi:ABC-2 type transport system ATP-binding protein
METSPSLLKVSGLSRRFGEVLAVDGLSFEVRPGEILGLVGPNGAGKTTSLRTIAGVLPIQEGQISVVGRDLDEDPIGAKSLLAWIPDEPQPDENLTVLEHLEFTAGIYGIGDWVETAHELLARFDLKEKAGALGGDLSRGMRQKLAFAQAWLTKPRVLLMDEPLSGLDPLGIRAAKAEILQMAAEGAAIVLSSHLLKLIEELADRLLILDAGRAVFTGTLEEARKSDLAWKGGSLEEIFLAATGAQSVEE